MLNRHQIIRRVPYSTRTITQTNYSKQNKTRQKSNTQRTPSLFIHDPGECSPHILASTTKHTYIHQIPSLFQPLSSWNHSVFLLLPSRSSFLNKPSLVIFLSFCFRVFFAFSTLWPRFLVASAIGSSPSLVMVTLQAPVGLGYLPLKFQTHPLSSVKVIYSSQLQLTFADGHPKERLRVSVFRATGTHHRLITDRVLGWLLARVSKTLSVRTMS